MRELVERRRARRSVAPRSRPHVSYDPRRQAWRLEHDYVVEALGLLLVVPALFECDLSSVPRLLWNLFAPFSFGLGAPVVHDWIYRHGWIYVAHESGDPATRQRRPCTRAEADRAFREIMRADGVPLLQRTAAYTAVRLFGRRAWRS